jgi:hypothetical protein
MEFRIWFMRTTTRFLVILVGAFSALLTGCEPDEEAEVYDEVPGPVVGLTSYPLAVGNVWNYVMTVDITGPDATQIEYLVKSESLLDTTIEMVTSTKIRYSQSVNGGALMYVGDRYYNDASHGLDMFAVAGFSVDIFF